MAQQVTSDMLAAGAAVANVGAGGITPNELSQPFTRGTAQATTTGTDTFDAGSINVFYE